MAKFKTIMGRLALMLLPVAVFIAVALVFFSRKTDALSYVQHPMEGHPLKAQYDADKANFPATLAYYEYWVYAFRPYASATINITDFYSARLAPDSAPPETADCRIWMFGGSTLADMETADALTIANQLAVSLKARGLAAQVVNFGMPGFASSAELLKFQDILRRCAESRQPDAVIFYDGYNDPYLGWVGKAGNLQPDLSAKLEMVVTKQFGRYLVQQVSDALGARFALWQNTVGHRLAARAAKPEQNIDQVVHIYLANVRMARAVAQEFGITPFFVLQPLLTTKQPLSAREQEIYNAGGRALKAFVGDFYGRVRAGLAKEPDFLDLSGVLNGRTAADFYDECHTGPYTGEVIGRALADRLAESLLARAARRKAPAGPDPTEPREPAP